MEENQTEQPEYEILPDDYPKYDLPFKIIIIGNSELPKVIKEAIFSFQEKNYIYFTIIDKVIHILYVL